MRQRYNPYGGAERFIERALPALERAGAEVTLICRDRKGWDARALLRVDPPFLGNLWRDWSFARAARAAWRERRFDLVQSHERIAGCELYRAGDGVHRCWLEIRRRSAGALERFGMLVSPYHRYVCAAERRMFEHPRLRAVICNSKMVRDEIRDAFRIAPEKLHVIYNGVDLDYFHPEHRAALRPSARAALGVGSGERAFLFVGSGFARKGLDAAIAALAACAGEPFRLIVAGRDRDAKRFRARAAAAGVADRIHFVGGVDDVRPLYAAADCFILPTRYDPFPGAVLEALAMGLPAIVGRRSGAAEIVQPGASGWICEPEDVPGLATLMRETARVATEDRLAAARATAEGYGIDAMADRLARLYAALLALRRDGAHG